MIHRSYFLMLVGALVTLSQLHASPDTIEDQINTLEYVIDQFPQPQIVNFSDKNIREFNEEELLKLTEKILNHKATKNMPSVLRHNLANIRRSLVSRLKEYHVTGVAFGVDFNFAWLFNCQNPTLTVAYKNLEGDIKFRTYESSIESVGFKFECAVKLNLMFITDADFNFYESDKIIKIGTGIDITSGFEKLLGFGVDFTYAPFKNAPGGLVIIGFPLSLPLLTIPLPGLSVVTGGSLYPVN